MAQLWGGRFKGATDDLVYAFNASLRFDKRLISQDIAGSKAHVRMLGRCGILPTEEVRYASENENNLSVRGSGASAAV